MLSEDLQVHLVVDGYGAAQDRLEDADLLYRFLDEYPASIGMTKMIAPQVYTYHGKTPEDWGLSGFVLIAESHISVHTYPERRYINIDIFSCKDFDADVSLSEVRDTFALPEVRVWTMERGVEYSSPREAYHGMARERVNLGRARNTTHE